MLEISPPPPPPELEVESTVVRYLREDLF